ncbi:MAG TPA: replication initiator, partial [Micromonosporaceae bacterium]
EATGHNSTRITADTINLHADEHGAHTARLIDACWRLGRPTTKQHARLPQRRPARQLGPRWRCAGCRRPTRLNICPHCPAPTPADTRVQTAARARAMRRSAVVSMPSGVRHTEAIDLHADEHGPHTARLIDACWRLGRPTTKQHAALPERRPARQLGPRWRCRSCRRPTRLKTCPHCAGLTPADTRASKAKRDNPYTRLRRWAHMLGYGGHFLTKARRYSVTFSVLRCTRLAYRRNEDRYKVQAVRAVDHLDEETTVIVGTLTYAGIGWRTAGDALLANTAAALARERRAAGREELAHEIGTAVTVAQPVAA